jgi:hypothetical protein
VSEVKLYTIRWKHKRTGKESHDYKKYTKAMAEAKVAKESKVWPDNEYWIEECECEPCVSGIIDFVATPKGGTQPVAVIQRTKG